MAESLQAVLDIARQLAEHLQSHFQIEGEQPPASGSPEYVDAGLAVGMLLQLRSWAPDRTSGVADAVTKGTDAIRLVSKLRRCVADLSALFELPAEISQNGPHRIPVDVLVPAATMQALRWCILQEFLEGPKAAIESNRTKQEALPSNITRIVTRKHNTFEIPVFSRQTGETEPEYLERRNELWVKLVDHDEVPQAVVAEAWQVHKTTVHRALNP